MNKAPAALLLLALVAACTQGEMGETPAPSPVAEAIGEPRDCLPLTQFSNTRIRDDHTIDFIGGAGNKVWRVTLPNRCNGLKSADTFTYETSLSQLCRQDIIYPLQQLGGSFQRGPGCGLAPFVPVKLAR
ncbi:hypothetical protein [Novosphingobium sp. P6W]|uniref:hypothetical protein n=1 Tax=Novosphingobium sp. P6W TaxID=1609758 RepID=UPI0005C2E45D|nr:hypothetical protein [Novosphingobium sp. P6W]AXB75693.1 hypothetical protein TQ38_003480 [Novosphingobium sp. P6W]KIS33083.1 hypothetical protein TQ38_06400 [Novosphingobium sp. P6W]